MTVRRTALAVGLALGLSACGSTVPLARSGQVLTTGDGLGAQVPTGAATAGTTSTLGSAPTGGTGTTATTAGSRTGTTGSTAPGTTTTTAVRPGTSTVPRGTGTVRVGLLYIDGADKAAGALGIDGVSTGDAKAQAAAVVAHLNATGGLNGQRVEVREGKMDASRMSSDAEGAHAEACSKLTQDDKVAYVVSYVQLTSSQLACYAKRGVVVLDDQSSVLDSTGAQYAATFGSPGELALGRAAEELVDALWRRGWLTAASKVGTYVYDTPDGVALETRHLAPALARHGLKIEVNARSSSTADGANQSGTVIKMSSAGVDRVIPIGASPLFLMTAAQTQGYHPRYAITSTFGPGALLEGSAKEQLKGAAGIGWSKYLDIGAGTKPAAVSPNETLCFELMRKAGQQSSSATTQAFQVALCNVLMFLKKATDTYGVTPDLLTQVRTRGLDFAPADAFAIRMQPGRADGVAAYRDLVFDDGCGCFQYVGGNQPT